MKLVQKKIHSNDILRMIYLSTSRIPGEKANTYQVLQMVDAFAAHKVAIRLLYPRRVNTAIMRRVKDIKQYYGLNNEFSVIELPAIDLMAWPQKIFGWAPRVSQGFQNRLFEILIHSYSRSVSKYLTQHSADLYFTRSFKLLVKILGLSPRLAPRLFFEGHRVPWEATLHPEKLKILSQIGGVITVNQSLKDEYTRYGIGPQKIMVAPAGVNLKRFEDVPDKRMARRALHKHDDHFLIGYVGHLYPWKGIDTLVQSMLYLSPKYHLVLVGGLPADIRRVQKQVAKMKIPRTTLSGYLPPTEILPYLAAVDVLVLPTSGKEKMGHYYTSPLKLFEYMAVGRPIVASDLPSTREILQHERNAYLVRADDPSSLAQGIRWVSEHPELAQSLAEQARLEVQAYSWENRAQKIIDFMEREKSC